MKKFGIKVCLPSGDTMSAPHLLGDDWQTFRWFESAEKRDMAYAEMERQPPYYRKGDSPTVVLEKIDQDAV